MSCAHVNNNQRSTFGEIFKFSVRQTIDQRQVIDKENLKSVFSSRGNKYLCSLKYS